MSFFKLCQSFELLFQDASVSVSRLTPTGRNERLCQETILQQLYRLYATSVSARWVCFCLTDTKVHFTLGLTL